VINPESLPHRFGRVVLADRELSAAGVAEYVPFAYYLLDCTYADYQKLVPELPRLGAREQETDFTDRVAIQVGLPVELGEPMCTRVIELTAGRCVPEKIADGMDLK